MRVAFERRVLHLFDRLLDQPLAERERWLEEATAGDAELVRAVTALVAADSRSDALPTMLPEAGDAADPPLPPERLGNYAIVRELGRGGMGVVYLAERADGLYEQQVALKLLRQHVSGHAAAAFEAERRMLARIEHPNVARLIDGGVGPDGRPWLATEYVDGATIDRDHATRPLGVNVRLFLQAAHAVQFAHSRLIAHGDVKPANILVGDGDRVKLLDFGVARLTGEASDALGAFTPGFASPERLAGAGVSVADDVYALGRTLESIVNVARDRELAAVIGCATAIEKRRYPTVQALIADLEHWAAHRPVAAFGKGAVYRARKFIGRHRVGAAATLLALVALAATAIVAQRNYVRAERARSAEALRFADAHRTAHYLMFTLLDRLERRPGTLRLRAQVGDVAQVYLDRLANSPGAPREVRLDVAQGYLRAAQMAGMGNAPNLGDVDRATRNLAQARRMLETLRGEQPQWSALAAPVARAASLACQDQLYGDHDAARALRVAQDGLAEIAGIVPDRGTRAIAGWPVRICAGDALVWLNRTAEAVPLLERDAAAARRRRPIDEAMLERNLRILGEAYYYANRFADAERVLKQAAAFQAIAHRRAPFFGGAVIEAANVADDLASTYEQQHRYADQLRIAEAARRLVEAQAALDADDVQSARRALSLTRLIAGAQARLGRAREGAAAMARADAGWTLLQRRFPDDATTARLRLLALHVTGDLQRSAGQGAAACTSYSNAALGWRQFARRWRISPSDTSENVDAIARKLAPCGEPR